MKRYDYQVIINQKFGTYQYRFDINDDWKTTILTNDIIGQTEHLFNKKVVDYQFCGYKLPLFDKAYFFTFE